MGSHLRGLVGLILGVVIGLLLGNLLNDALIEHGNALNGSLEVIIVAVVALVGCAAGSSTGPN